MQTLDLAPLAGPIIITCVYLFFWYYLLLVKQRGTKGRLRKEYAARNEEFDRYAGNDPEMVAADRVIINTQEQMVPFLISLWLFAFSVSPFYATIFGALYIVLRAIYPFLLGKRVSKINTKKVAFVTFPCYAIIFTFLIASLVEVLKQI